MKLYTQLFGENKHANRLLTMLGHGRDYFARYRDVFLNADGTAIIVYTRAGSADDRKRYAKFYQNYKLDSMFDSEWSDGFDDTYAYVKFRVKPRWLGETAKMATGKEPETVHEKFVAIEKAMSQMSNKQLARDPRFAKDYERVGKLREEGGILVQVDDDFEGIPKYLGIL